MTEIPLFANKPVPEATSTTGLRALRAIINQRSPFGALEVLHRELGDIFRIRFPGFNPVMLVGPEAARFLLVTARDDVRWRMSGEPIAHLLRHGVLVEDGESHDALRRAMNPALHRKMLVDHIDAMVRATDDIAGQWQAGNGYDMLVEMRKIALLILTDTLFGVDFRPDLRDLWDGILQAVKYISPGPWVVWRGLSHRGYNDKLRMIDSYLFRIITVRRENLGNTDDLLGALIAGGLSDDLIRDQLMTMLIAGHDTSTATLAWTLTMLGKHPQVMAQVREEVASALDGDAPPQFTQLGDLPYLDQVINETLRLYPPIHLGSRFAATDLSFNGYHIPAGDRVLYSIYLTHRHPDYWHDPHTFDPSRFETRPDPYTFVAFGGGPRNCIGAAFAQVEAKVVLARLLQRWQLRLVRDDVRLHMGATLEPRPGVMMRVSQ